MEEKYNETIPALIDIVSADYDPADGAEMGEADYQRELSEFIAALPQIVRRAQNGEVKPVEEMVYRLVLSEIAEYAGSVRDVIAVLEDVIDYIRYLWVTDIPQSIGQILGGNEDV